MTATEATQSPEVSPTAPESLKAKRALRRKLKTEGRKKRAIKLKTDKDFAKQYFEKRSKKSSEKKSAFRKKKSKKK